MEDQFWILPECSVAVGTAVEAGAGNGKRMIFCGPCVIPGLIVGKWRVVRLEGYRSRVCFLGERICPVVAFGVGALAVAEGDLVAPADFGPAGGDDCGLAEELSGNGYQKSREECEECFAVHFGFLLRMKSVSLMRNSRTQISIWAPGIPEARASAMAASRLDLRGSSIFGLSSVTGTGLLHIVSMLWITANLVGFLWNKGFTAWWICTYFGYWFRDWLAGIVDNAVGI